MTFSANIRNSILLLVKLRSRWWLHFEWYCIVTNDPQIYFLHYYFKFMLIVQLDTNVCFLLKIFSQM